MYDHLARSGFRQHASNHLHRINPDHDSPINRTAIQGTARRTSRTMSNGPERPDLLNALQRVVKMHRETDSELHASPE